MAENLSNALPPDGAASAAPLRWPGLLLGVAFGGFFDGIVLHQILQWHHLLSGLSEGRWNDLRILILADGVFHALMYALAALSGLLLFRRRFHLTLPGARDTLLVVFVTGFASWHFLDAVVSHWLLGIHRIRMDSAQPLAWDLGWLVIFGFLPCLWARRHARRALVRAPSCKGGSALMLLVGSTALAGALSARAPQMHPAWCCCRTPGTPGHC
ncbi:DUF2243 domain-containing protein [Hydrogenophaga sp.]|uniref:DUF2243 domain-containing protein n=1 Tax=Hydrogenophaga sp. TaxID=1904254 RepID=UPI003F717D1F